jgi:hypothetical protein
MKRRRNVWEKRKERSKKKKDEFNYKIVNNDFLLLLIPLARTSTFKADRTRKITEGRRKKNEIKTRIGGE